MLTEPTFGVASSSSADSTIPKGLQLILQGNARTTCTRPLGLGGDINNDLVQTSVMFEGSVSNPSGNDQDCCPALQNANAIGFVSSYDGVTFCVDDIQLIWRLVFDGIDDMSCLPANHTMHYDILHIYEHLLAMWLSHGRINKATFVVHS